jgi:hypothetical protein
MKITNKQGLPESFVQMAKSDFTADENTYRVTSLLKGVRETILERRHEAEQDVSDMIWMLFGTAAHAVLENTQETSTQIKEARLSEEINGRIISGKFDLYDEKTKTITDYKTCSVWKVIYGNFDDWRRQLLIYAYLMTKTGFEVNKGEIIAVLKDHSKRDAKVKADYPKLPVKKITFNFTTTDFEEIAEWLYAKVEELKMCEALPDSELPLCTPEERFNSGDKYAVMKKGRKTAMRVLDSLEDAEAWKDANGGEYIDVRKGEDKKCVDGYCSVCKFCDYWQRNYSNGK